jgi:hypothetical protein
MLRDIFCNPKILLISLLASAQAYILLRIVLSRFTYDILEKFND